MPTFIRRRQFVAGAAATLASPFAFAQEDKSWPSRPVKVIVPGGPGATLDTLARLLYARVQAVLGQPFVIDNRVGANGQIGSAAVKNAPPDGYTILHSTASSMVMAEALNPAQAVKTLRDLEPVALCSVGGNLLAAHPSVPAQTLAELVELVRREPQKYGSYGSWGVGTNGHLTMEWIKQRTGLPFHHVPYKTTPALLTDIVGGVIPVGWVDTASPLAFVAQGKLRALAVSGPARSPRLPEVKLISEQGYPFTTAGWQGVFAPRGTPAAIVERLHAVINQEQVHPDFVKALAQANIPAAEAVSRQAFAQLIASDLGAWRKIVVDGNIRAE
jgi:tripartite-type tricarboxylate transporter receptor subunit TctC